MSYMNGCAMKICPRKFFLVNIHTAFILYSDYNENHDYFLIKSLNL